MDKILVVNGPNINMLGIRELDKYGQTSYQELKEIIDDDNIDLIQKICDVPSHPAS